VGRWRRERVELLYAPRRDVPNLRRACDLPLGVLALQLWHLQLVPGGPTCHLAGRGRGRGALPLPFPRPAGVSGSRCRHAPAQRSDLDLPQKVVTLH
jgi:hypothetical protein